MSILKNDGFDESVDKSAQKLRKILYERRRAGLIFIKESLETADLSELNEEELLELALVLQKEVVSTVELAQKESESLSEEMVDISEESRKEAVSSWGLPASSELEEGDPRKATLGVNTADLFLLERDQALAQRVAERFSSGVIEEREKEKKQKKDFDPFSFFMTPWGEKAETQYWTLVSSAWLGRARNQSIAFTFADSGMEWCRIASQIDEMTTHVCRFLHMKRILVSSTVAESANLVAPNSTSNWIAETPPPPVGGLTADTQKPLLLLPPLEKGGKPRPLAQRTEEHIVGTAEFDMGKYDQYVSDEELAKTLGPPPYHFLCRTLLVPDDFEDPLGLQAEVKQKNPPPGIDDFISETF